MLFRDKAHGAAEGGQARRRGKGRSIAKGKVHHAASLPDDGALDGYLPREEYSGVDLDKGLIDFLDYEVGGNILAEEDGEGGGATEASGGDDTSRATGDSVSAEILPSFKCDFFHYTGSDAEPFDAGDPYKASSRQAGQKGLYTATSNASDRATEQRGAIGAAVGGGVGHRPQ